MRFKIGSTHEIFDVEELIYFSIAADGISIPSSYTAFIAPLSSAKLLAEAARHRDWEMPYVVMFHACTQLASPKSVWTFEHPNRLLTVDEQGQLIKWQENKRCSSCDDNRFSVFYR